MAAIVPAGALTKTPAGLPLAAACACLLAVSFGVHIAKYPDFSGFWAGADQQRYLDAARAWAGFDLSPDKHHYLPLYPLLGAAFVRLTPWQPFMLPDAACWCLSLLLFVRIGRRLAPDWPDWVPAACFLAAVLGGRSLAAIWVVPWSTTGSAPWQFAAILLALRLGEVFSPRRAAALGAAIAIVAGFRPSDAAVLIAGIGPFAAMAAWRAGARAAWAGLAAASAGLAAGLLPWMAAHHAVFGWSLGRYLAESAAVGFEWRLLPLRWVLLVVDPRPLLPEGRGMAEAFLWVAPGIAGLMLGISRQHPRPDSPARLAAFVVALHWAAYLAYRDMHAYGLWRFYNVHYFKWTFPFLILWAAQLAAAFARRAERRRAVCVLLASLCLFVWRPVLHDLGRAPLHANARGLVLDGGLSPLSRAVRLPLSGHAQALYLGAAVLQVGLQDFRAKRDIKMLPDPAGALLVPLRELPPGPATLILPPGVSVALPSTYTMLSQSIVPGLPCGVWRPSCTPP